MLNVVISSTVLILGILLIRLIFREKINPKLRYALWGLLVFRLAIFNIPSITTFKSPISVQNMITFTQDNYLNQEFLAQMTGIIPNSDNNIGTAGTSGMEVVNTAMAFSWNELLMIIWIIGIVIFLAWFIIVNLLFSKKVFRTRESLDFEAEKLNLKGLSVYLSDSLSTPCLMRYRGETAIYVTREIASDKEKLFYAVIHELCHNRHHDILWGNVRIFLLSIYWFHPFIWISAMVSKRDCELACDYEVIQMIGEENRIEYGKTLIFLAQIQQHNKMLHISSATMMCENEKDIKTRIKQIAKNKKMLPTTLLMVVVLVITFTLSTFTGGIGDYKAEDGYHEETTSYYEDGLEYEETATDYMNGGGYEETATDYIDGWGYEEATTDYIDGWYHGETSTYVEDGRGYEEATAGFGEVINHEEATVALEEGESEGASFDF